MSIVIHSIIFVPAFRLRRVVGISVREGLVLGGRKQFALKVTICPKNKQFALKITF